MQIVELLNKAKQGYSDMGDLSVYYDSTTGELDTSATGDTLAKFIVEELIGTFNAEASDESQVKEAIRVMRNAAYQIDDVVRALRG